MKYILRRFIPLSIILLFLFQPSMVLANSAPVYKPAGANGAIIPMDNIQVLVKGEKLQFVLYDDFKPAQVTVQYIFMNPTKQSMEPLLVFPYTPSDEGNFPRIFVNGKEIPPANIDQQVDPNQLKGFLEHFHSTVLRDIDPVTGEKVNKWSIYDDESFQIRAAVFKVPFQAQKETTLRLEYKQQVGMDKTAYINPVYLYQYLLQPASAWKEFQHLEINIVVPKNHYFSSNLTFKKYNSNFKDWLELPKEVKENQGNWQFFQGQFGSLPKENLAFSTMSKDGLLFGMVDKGSYDLIGLLLLGIVATLAIIGVALLLDRIKKWWMHWLLGPILSFIVSNILTFVTYAIYLNLVPIAANGELVGGYGFIFTFLFFGFYNTIAYFPIMLIIRLIKRRRLKKQLKAIEGE